MAQNLPQRLPHGLYPERISGTSFTTLRKDNKQTWLYRTLPSVSHAEWKKVEAHPLNFDYQSEKLQFSPNKHQWMPLPLDGATDFVTGLKLLAGAGEPSLKTGVAYYTFGATRSMLANQAFRSDDGDFLIGIFALMPLEEIIILTVDDSRPGRRA